MLWFLDFICFIYSLILFVYVVIPNFIYVVIPWVKIMFLSSRLYLSWLPLTGKGKYGMFSEICPKSDTNFQVGEYINSVPTESSYYTPNRGLLLKQPWRFPFKNY